MRGFFPKMWPSDELPNGAIAGERHQEPIDRQTNQRRHLVSAAPERQSSSRQQRHRQVAGREIEEVEPDNRGGNQAAVAPQKKRIGGDDHKRRQIDRMDYHRHDHAGADEIESDELAKADLPRELEGIAHVDEPRLHPALVYLFVTVHSRSPWYGLCLYNNRLPFDDVRTGSHHATPVVATALRQPEQ